MIYEDLKGKKVLVTGEYIVVNDGILQKFKNNYLNFTKVSVIEATRQQKNKKDLKNKTGSICKPLHGR